MARIVFLVPAEELEPGDLLIDGALHYGVLEVYPKMVGALEFTAAKVGPVESPWEKTWSPGRTALVARPFTFGPSRELGVPDPPLELGEALEVPKPRRAKPA